MTSPTLLPVAAVQPGDGEPSDAVFSPIEMKVLALAAHTVLHGRPCADSARFLRRVCSTVLGERPPNPLV